MHLLYEKSEPKEKHMSLAMDANFLFGDRSTFFHAVHEQELAKKILFLNQVKLGFEKRAIEVNRLFLGDKPPTVRVDQLLLPLYELQLKWNGNQSLQVVDELRSAIHVANDFLGSIPSELHTSDPLATSDVLTHRGTLMDAFQVLRADLGSTIGFGLVLDFMERSFRNMAPFLRKKYLPEKLPQVEQRKVVTPTLFFDSRGRHGGVGHVLWLEVELFSDYAGFCIPDILAHGMTDIKTLTSEMNEVWVASGLAKDFRAIWRFAEKYPGDHPDFVELDKSTKRRLCLPALSGRSIQGAALAAMWAASGRIPLPKKTSDSTESESHIEEYLTLDESNKSFRLTPFVAISAAIHPSGLSSGVSCYDTPLSPVEGIGVKVNAASKYAVSQDSNDSLFDAVIVCEENQGEAESEVNEIKKKATEDRIYRGVEIMSNCKTIGDALNWLLEVNIWKHAYNEHCREEWEGSWGDARNEHGHWLNKETGRYALDTPDELRINTGSIEFMKNKWAKVAGSKDTGQEDTKPEETGDIEVDPDESGS